MAERLRKVRDQDKTLREVNHFRNMPPTVGNQFLIYTLFPSANISVRMRDASRQTGSK